MRRMLDPTKVGGLPSTIEFDKDGNRKVTKNLGVGGKLTLKSLVSESNPDGDITNELGGGSLYVHYIRLRDGGGQIFLNYISSKAEEYTIQTLKAELTTTRKKILCSGYHKGIAQYFYLDVELFTIVFIDENGTTKEYKTPTFSTIQDYVEPI